MYLDIDLVWGGYYAHKELETKNYSITRILDFDIVQYQAVLYNEEYETLPTLETIDNIAPDNIAPLAFHVPMNTKALLLHTQEFTLIGRKALEPDDLEGYRYYLQDTGVPPEDIDELVNKLIHFSKNEPPLPIRLYLDEDNQLQIGQR